MFVTTKERSEKVIGFIEEFTKKTLNQGSKHCRDYLISIGVKEKENDKTNN